MSNQSQTTVSFDMYSDLIKPRPCRWSQRLKACDIFWEQYCRKFPFLETGCTKHIAGHSKKLWVWLSIRRPKTEDTTVQAGINLDIIVWLFIEDLLCQDTKKWLENKEKIGPNLPGQSRRSEITWSIADRYNSSLCVISLPGRSSAMASCGTHLINMPRLARLLIKINDVLL